MPDQDDITPSLLRIRDEEFGVDQARHLLWRAGFGGTRTQIDTLVTWGPEKAVDTLLGFGAGSGKPAFQPVTEDLFKGDIMRAPTQAERQRYRQAQLAQDEDTLAEFRRMRQEREGIDRRQAGEMQKWWLKRMIETKYPLEEKLTLFWHGHFATSYRTIEDSYHMFRQNQLFRQHAAGNFGKLLAAIIRDPAMIAYLDNNDSRKDRPNENLAREIMELFSLGVGNYSEGDIKQGARSLTGYTFEDNEFLFRRNNHDSGTKTILGQTGGWDGDDFVRIILSKRACANYIVRRLYNAFVHDVPPDERGGDKNLDNAQRAVIRELGEMLMTRQYELRPVLKRLFMSKHFYDDTFVRQQIKSPAQLVVGAVRSLHTPVRDLGILNEAMDLMGQRLFHPPSVKGWDGGRTWINTSTLFVRQNVLAYLLSGKKPQGYDATADSDRYDATVLLDGLANKDNPDQVARHLLMTTLGTAHPTDASVATLKNYLASKQDRINDETVLGCVLIATAMPEYQLC
jgi:uncharacterized protein (DUF1800 family)